jgi:hypothetical protein
MPEMTAAEALARACEPDLWQSLDATADHERKHGYAQDYDQPIARLRELGFAIVPVEATKQMIAAGDMLTYREERFRVSAVWREMVSAYAPDAEKEKL